MTTPATGPSQTFVLREDAPNRALAIASVSAVVGAILMVLWGANGWSAAVLVIGILLLAFGVALVVAAILASRRRRQTVEVTETGLTLNDSRGARTVRWSEVRQVTLNGPRLALLTGDGTEVAAQVLNPGGRSHTTFMALAQAVQTALDADRGYRSFG